MPLQQIPLVPNVQQSFQITLLINGSYETLELAVNYSEMANCWLMDISDNQGNTLLASIPLVTGAGVNSRNILGQYGYLNLGSAYVQPVSTSAPDYPALADLGVTHVLLWE